jgi:hypothetical protein
MLGGEATVGPYMPLKRPLIPTFLKFVTLDYSLVSPTHVLASLLPNREKRPSTHPFLPSIEDLLLTTFCMYATMLVLKNTGIWASMPLANQSISTRQALSTRKAYC